MTADVKYEIAAPDPAGMVASLSSLGYSLPAAIADLVDNSISAGALNIDVEFTWAGADSWIAVVDDGDGMTPDQLLTAMTVAARGPAAERSATDLGRFGVGLKSASFSQARELTVTSAVDGDWHTRTWDLNVVEASGEWRLLHHASAEADEVLRRLRGDSRRGTVVLWRHLNGYAETAQNDERTQRQFYAEVTRTEGHLGMIFERFLAGSRKRSLRVSGEDVQPWDPFMSSHPSVQRLPVEFHVAARARVRIEAFILPNARRLEPAEHEWAAGPGGWLDQQGFYVYRRDRLIVAGDWLGLRGTRREERYNLARIAVDIPAESDAEWGVDVRKSSVSPPVGLRPHLQRIAQNARAQAADVLRHRGQVAARAHGDPLVYAWSVTKRDGRLKCRVNRSHPLVQAVLRPGGNDPAYARALIRLLEETVPVATLRVMHEPDVEDDPDPFDITPAENEGSGAAEVGQRIFESLVAGGRSPDAARARLRTLSPFDRLHGFWST
jgi:SH3-like domain-containing protein